jgi:hypothetical protein
MGLLLVVVLALALPLAVLRLDYLDLEQKAQKVQKESE